MFKSTFRILAAAVLAAVVVSCGGPNGSDGDTPAGGKATLEETVTGINALMADAVSVASGILSNSTVTDMGGFPDCFNCTMGSHVIAGFFPGIVLLVHEWSESSEGEPVNLRIPTGTYTFNEATDDFDYDAEPSTALVFEWQHRTTGEDVVLRIDWDDVQKVRVYEQEIYLPSAPYVPADLGSLPYYLTGEEIDVPGKITITARQGSQQIVDLNIEQTWAVTECGPLFEYRTVTASGQVRSGAQIIDLRSFEFDHSVDNRVAISLEGSVASGTLSLPFSFSADATAGSVGRSDANCQLDSVEGPFSGSFDVQAGATDSGVGVGFDWNMTFEENDLERLERVAFESAKLTIGRKTVDISGSLDSDAMSGYTDVDVSMTFADRTNMSIADFLMELTFPGLP